MRFLISGYLLCVMKTYFSSIELAYLVKEFQEVVGARINKVFQPSEKQVVIECFKTRIGRFFVNVLRPGLVWVGSEKLPSGDFGFARNLDQQISGSRILSVRQVGSERLIVFELKKGQVVLWVYVELFTKGNIIVCNGEEKIIAVWETQVWKDRELKSGARFVLPQAGSNIFVMSVEEFVDILVNSKESVSKTLASEVGIGGLYAEEVCLLSGVGKTAARVTPAEARVLYDSFRGVMNRKSEGCVVYEGSLVKDVTPFPLKRYAGLRCISCAKFNDALNSVLFRFLSETSESRVSSEFESKKKKLENVIEVQKIYLSVVEKEARDSLQRGKLVYEQYQKLKESLDRIITARKTFSFKEIKARAKEFGIKELDEEKGEIVVEV